MLAIDEFQVVAEKQLLEQVGGVTVDFTANEYGEGFQIRTGNQPKIDCGSCSC